MSNSEATTTKCTPAYQDVDHFKIPAAFSVDAFNSALKYQPRNDDLFIVTYPKCGTNWVQNIVSLIYRHGKPFSTALDYLTNTPFLEVTGAKAAETMKRPGAIKIHLPFHLTPYSPKAKYLYVARNPKDCCVSFYYHTKNGLLYEYENGSFDDYFELFLAGKVDFGDYFDNLLSWYSHRNDDNVLFITYEELKKDPEKGVLRISEFMGKEYKEAMEADPKFLKDSVYYSSFSHMKEAMNQKFDEMAKLPPEEVESNPDIPDSLKKWLLDSKGQIFATGKCEFVRKGIVGDWRNHFSEDQNKRLEAKFRERTKGTDIFKLWENDM